MRFVIQLHFVLFFLPSLAPYFPNGKYAWYSLNVLGKEWIMIYQEYDTTGHEIYANNRTQFVSNKRWILSSSFWIVVWTNKCLTISNTYYTILSGTFAEKIFFQNLSSWFEWYSAADTLRPDWGRMVRKLNKWTLKVIFITKKLQKTINHLLLVLNFTLEAYCLLIWFILVWLGNNLRIVQTEPCSQALLSQKIPWPVCNCNWIRIIFKTDKELSRHSLIRP